MKNVYQGIYSVLYPRLEGVDLHAGFALQESFPYVTFTVGATDPLEYLSDNVGYDTFDVTFNVFDTDFDNVSDIMAIIATTFEDNNLTVPGASFVSAYRGSREIVLDPDQAETGESVWHGILMMEIEIQEART